MKKLAPLFLSGLLLMSCSSEDSPAPEKEPANLAPSQPVLMTPVNDLFCTTPELEFTWAVATDPEGDAIKYQLEIASNPQFTQIFYTTETSQTSKTVTLSKGSNFYWRVSAQDEGGQESEVSASRMLYTEGEATSNFMPTAPERIKPSEGEIVGATVNLAWNATDADGDKLTYDLYLGKNTSPDLLAENLAEESYQVSLEEKRNYYWKIVAKDENGGKTSGQVWSFKTE